MTHISSDRAQNFGLYGEVDELSKNVRVEKLYLALLSNFLCFPRSFNWYQKIINFTIIDLRFIPSQSINPIFTYSIGDWLKMKLGQIGLPCFQWDIDIILKYFWYHRSSYTVKVIKATKTMRYKIISSKHWNPKSHKILSSALDKWKCLKTLFVKFSFRNPLPYA